MRMATGGVGSIMMDDVRRRQVAADYSAATLHRKNAACASAAGSSGNDVGKQLVFQPADPVLEGKLSLLHALDADGIDPPRFDHCRDRGVEIAVLLAKLGQLPPDARLLLLAQAPAAGCHD